jgi:acetolactate synthase-1/2/3 large subunit
MDQIPVAAPLCKYARLVDRPERIPFYVGESCARATSGRPGPVHLTIPSDVLAAKVEPMARRPGTVKDGGANPLAGADSALVQEAVALIQKAERPILVAGSGAFYAQANEVLEEFVAATAMPVVVPIWDRGVISRPIENFVGFVGAASGGPRLLPHADLILLVGARVDYRVGYAEPPGIAENAQVIRIDVDADELAQGIVPDVAILADPASALAMLAAAFKKTGDKPRREWLDEAKTRDRDFHRAWADPSPTAPPITGRHIVEALQPFLDDRTRFLVDGGNIGQWAHMLTNRYPGHWLTCGASGVVGWGIAGAIAAKLAYPDQPVILLSGDGAIGFGLPELETAVRHSTPFVAVLADDRAWGSVAGSQRKNYGPDGFIASRLGPVDYAMVAEGFGGLGLRVTRAEEIGPAVQQGLEAGRPTLIHVPTALAGPADG